MNETQGTKKVPLRLGIIGAGRIIERMHIPVLQAMNDIIIAGIYDPDQVRAQEIAATIQGLAVCSSLDELLQLNVDVVLVACPNYLHAEASIAALEANAHVICEKPMARSASEAHAMVEASQRTGKKLMIAYVNRFRPEIMMLYALVQQGALGDIEAVRCEWLRRAGVPGIHTWFTSRAQAGGGVLIDLGSHLLNIALGLRSCSTLSGAFCRIDSGQETWRQASWYEVKTEQISPCDVETSASGFAVFDESFDIFLDVSWNRAIPHDRTTLSVFGTRGTARIDTLFGFSTAGVRPPRPLSLWSADQLSRPLLEGMDDVQLPFRMQWTFFIDCIREDRNVQSLLQDSLRTAQAVDALYQAAQHRL